MIKIKTPSYMTRMMLSYVLLALVASALGIGSVYTIQGSITSSQAKIANRALMTRRATHLHDPLEERRRVERLFADSKDKEHIDRWTVADKEFSKALATLGRIDHRKSMQQDLKRVETANNKVRRNWLRLIESFENSNDFSVKGQDIDDEEELEAEIFSMIETERTLVKTTEESALTEVNRTLEMSFLVSGIVLVFAIGMALYMSSTLKKPLRQLFDAAKRISKGELGHKIDLDRPDEIGDLTTAFDEMSTELNFRQEELDKNVADLQSAKDLLETYSHDLEFKNKELESFVYSVSHDLKAPLIAIQGFLTMFANEFDEKLSHKAHFYLSRVRANSEQMHALIRQLLELSRIGENSDTLQSINMQTLVDETLDDLSLQLESKRAKVRLVGDWPEIIGYPLSVKQALRNLVDNAIHYKSNSRRLEIEIGVEETSSFWHLYVRDNGMGVDPVYHKNIFDLFERAGISQTMNEQGTGMGLAIVRKIAENHGGTVGVKSKLDNGSTFFFEISKDIAKKEEARLEV